MADGLNSRLAGVSALAVLLAALLTVACENQPDVAAPEGPSMAHGIDAPRSADFNRDLAALRRAVAPYHNFDRAVAAGWDTPITPCWYHSELGAMGYHYADLDLLDGTVSVREPQTLMYEPGPAGQMRFVGVEYIVPADAWEGSGPPELFGREFAHLEAAGLYVLHVWVGRHNPEGMFADWNPLVSCAFAEESEDLS